MTEDLPPKIESIQTSLSHVAGTLQELRDDHKVTQAKVVEISIALARLDSVRAERGKVGDYVMSAVISILTSFGMAKLLIGSAAQQK